MSGSKLTTMRLLTNCLRRLKEEALINRWQQLVKIQLAFVQISKTTSMSFSPGVTEHARWVVGMTRNSMNSERRSEISSGMHNTMPRTRPLTMLRCKPSSVRIGKSFYSRITRIPSTGFWSTWRRSLNRTMCCRTTRGVLLLCPVAGRKKVLAEKTQFTASRRILQMPPKTPRTNMISSSQQRY